MSKSRFAIYLSLALLGASSARGARAQQAVRLYILELPDEPVIAHLGHESPVANLRLNLEGADAAGYQAQLSTRQSALKSWIEALPEAKVLAQVDTVFNGMAVSLRPEDVAAVRQHPGVSDVVEVIAYHKVLDAAAPLINAPQAWADLGGEGSAGVGIRIGLIDTGIDITNPMLQDPSLVPPAGFPRFTGTGPQCPVSDQRFTNSKVIVARNYFSLLLNPDMNCDAEDRDGHGTFNAAIAAGLRVSAPLASISGIAPKAFLGSYKVTGTPGVNDEISSAAILKALDDAVKDGMQIVNLSLGAAVTALPTADPLAVAVTTAVNGGVTVVVAAGNQGPGTGTITSPGISPAAITVGATTNSRLFGNPLLITADLPVPSQLQQIGSLQSSGQMIPASVGPAPLVDVITVDPTGLGCAPLPQGSLGGAMALIRRGICDFSVKIQNVSDAGAVAAIIYNNQLNQPPVAFTVQASTEIPAAMIGNADGTALTQFLATSAEGGVEATLSAQQAAVPIQANRVSSFSSVGPSTDFGIKPDLVAPGEDIYSATQRNDPAGNQYDPSGFAVFCGMSLCSGTSFATPMVTGAAALVKQAQPGFSPAQIKSALVNTAAKVVTNTDGSAASVLAQGNGLLNVSDALNTPFLVAPVSIGFGDNASGSVLNANAILTVTNTGGNSDSFAVSVTPSVGGVELALIPSVSTFTLAGGATTPISLTATSSGPVFGTVEGYINITSQSSQRTVTVPYWGTFLNPSVNASGVVNAASFGSGPASVVAGELVSIFGTDMSNGTTSTGSVPLPTSLAGTTVTIGGVAAPLLSASPTQINAQVPFEMASRSFADLVVSLDGVSSAPRTLFLLPSAPGIFTVNQSGNGTGAVLHASNSTLVGPANPARPGEFLEIFATGLGAVTPSVATGSDASNSPMSFTLISSSVTIGGVPAPVTFSGLAPFAIGLYQINVLVPNGLPPGSQVLNVTSNGITSNSVTISIGD